MVTGQAVAWSARFDLRVPPAEEHRRSQQFRDALDIIEQLDRAGCTSIVLSEHHGSDDSYPPAHTPSPLRGRPHRACLASPSMP